MKNKRGILMIACLVLLLSASGCSVFRKGCKCPTVHGYKQGAAGLNR